MKSITRCEYKRCQGWWVRVQWMKKMYSRMFSDSRWGGKRRALREAIAYRDALEQQLGKPRTDRTVQALGRGKNSVPGVIHRVIRGKRVYIASWPTRKPGKGGRAYFYVSVYGLRGAKALATSLRARKIEEVYLANRIEKAYKKGLKNGK